MNPVKLRDNLADHWGAHVNDCTACAFAFEGVELADGSRQFGPRCNRERTISDRHDRARILAAAYVRVAEDIERRRRDLNRRAGVKSRD